MLRLLDGEGHNEAGRHEAGMVVIDEHESTRTDTRRFANAGFEAVLVHGLSSGAGLFATSRLHAASPAMSCLRVIAGVL